MYFQQAILQFVKQRIVDAKMFMHDEHWIPAAMLLAHAIMALEALHRDNLASNADMGQAYLLHAETFYHIVSITTQFNYLHETNVIHRNSLYFCT